MSERLILQGALAEKKMQRMELAAKAEGIIRRLKMILQPASVTPLRELNTTEVRIFGIVLDEVKEKYVGLCNEIAEIERELGVNG